MLEGSRFKSAQLETLLAQELMGTFFELRNNKAAKDEE